MLSMAFKTRCILATVTALAAVPALAAGVLVSGSQFQLPEGITAAPGGGYLVAESVNDTIVPVSATGVAGTPNPVGFRVFGTVVLSSFYGTNAGNVYAYGLNGSGVLVGPTGLDAPTTVTNAAGRQFVGSVVAGTAFGVGDGAVAAGQVLLTDNSNHVVVRLNSDCTTSVIAAPPGANFGIVMAPDTFGSYGGDLFTSDTFGDTIAITGRNGQTLTGTFATLPLPQGFSGPGLRQMAFAPADFGVFCGNATGNVGGKCYGDLFVSVAAQNGGGGSNGYIEAIDASGNLVAGYAFTQGGVTPLDPRGLLFVDANTLIVANADPGLNVLAPADFVAASDFLAVPEAPTWAMLLAGFAAIGVAQRRHGRAVPG